MISSPVFAGASPGFAEVRAGSLGVRLAMSAAEIDASQALRYWVFYQEMGAHPDAETAASQRDRDRYDDVADHLLVLDHALGDGPESVIGTYRLIRKPAAAHLGRFYTADEFDITPILQNGGEVLELGRSCVDVAYRKSSVMQLLWRGIASYVNLHAIDLMFGCASLPGTDPDLLATDLTYLYLNHLAPAELRPRAVAARYIEMNRVAPDSFEPRRALAKLPPLIKGYLRLGGFVGDGAVIDAQFNTIDVAVVVKTDLVTEKYLRHYERELRDAGAGS